MFLAAKEVCPEIDIHISTQANNVNYMTFRFWHDQGATRVVTGRELSLAEIREIRDRIPEELEIETFVHGAMCISYSGRCLLSNFLTGGMRTAERVPTHAVGNTRWWRRRDRENICRFMRTSAELIFLIPRICV